MVMVNHNKSDFFLNSIIIVLAVPLVRHGLQFTGRYSYKGVISSKGFACMWKSIATLWKSLVKPLYTISTSTTIELYVGEQYYDIAQTSRYKEDMSQLYWMQIQSNRKVLNNSETVQISMCPSRKIYLIMVLHSLRLLVSTWGVGKVMVLINEIQRASPFYLQECIKMGRDFWKVGKLSFKYHKGLFEISWTDTGVYLTTN